MLGLEILNNEFSGNTIQSYLEAFTIFVVIIFILQLIKVVLLVRLRSIAQQTENRWDDILCNALDSFGWAFYFVIALFLATQVLTLADFIERLLNGALIVVITYYAVKALQIILEHSLDLILQKASGEKPDNTILHFLHNALKIGLWVAAIILILQKLGI